MTKQRFTNEGNRYRAVVIGASAGGLSALGNLAAMMPARFDKMVIVVQHLYPQNESTLYQYLNDRCALAVREARDKESIAPGVIYTAPANYHLMVEKGETFSLSVDEKVNYSRPSIDVVFESAARVWKGGLIGVILTGANHDGAAGLEMVERFGGLSIVQDPATAEFPVMPQAAIDTGAVKRILTLEEIGNFLVEIAGH